MVSKSRKWLLRFRHKKSSSKSGKVNVITESDLADDESTCVPPCSVADSLDEALNDTDCTVESIKVPLTDHCFKNIVQENISGKVEEEQKQQPFSNLDHHHIESKKMCLKLLRKYSRSAIEELDYLSEEDISTERSSTSSSDGSLTYDDTLNSCQDDIPTISTQPTMTTNESNSTATSSSGIGLDEDEQDETTTVTFASSVKEDSPFSIIFGPLLCGLATADTTAPLYSKVRFVASCGQSNANLNIKKSNSNIVNNKYRNLTIKNITVENNEIPSSFSISEVYSDDITEIETSFTTDDEDIITVFTCRSIDDKGVTLYSAVSADEDNLNQEHHHHHTGRYDI